mmetsp:Transcript_34672/g.107226  ORF Transcript_34672/g.107226 Transcript_34672/m.107226 type:complete len:285 (+) Transcript_34672:339-1193(+)
MRLCVAVALCAARAAARSQPHAAAKPAKPRSTRPLCAAATVAPFHPARPLSNATELYPNPACSARYAELRAINARPTEVVTITYLYYADSEFLAKHVEYWNAYPTTLLEKIHFLVVDDGSPAGRRAAPIVEKNRGPASVSVVEIDQDLVWNVAGARNLAAVRAVNKPRVAFKMHCGAASARTRLYPPTNKKTSPCVTILSLCAVWSGRVPEQFRDVPTQCWYPHRPLSSRRPTSSCSTTWTTACRPASRSGPSRILLESLRRATSGTAFRATRSSRTSPGRARP